MVLGRSSGRPAEVVGHGSAAGRRQRWPATAAAREKKRHFIYFLFKIFNWTDIWGFCPPQ
jgi:hypothetical protein